MKARLLPPREEYTGNLVWSAENFKDKKNEIKNSLITLRALGYWASPYPEGDGITFSLEAATSSKTHECILSDFTRSFPWVTIELAKSISANLEIAELERTDRDENCIVIVPIDKIYIQNTLKLGKYTYFCARHFDPAPHDRLSNIKGSYLQFECSLNYIDLLKLNHTLDHNNHVINKCLSLAEYGLDIVRYSHSTFKKKEFTPNPAGQSADGFYDVEIIPLGKSHLKPLKICGIAQPLSVSNNWLGPQVDDFYYPGTQFLAEIYNFNFKSDVTASIISSMRLCRQAFYSIGKESQFLSLIFALDGLANPQRGWSGWKHRTYIAALCCQGSQLKFKKILEEYDRLYTDIRNELVHNGKSFYELEESPDSSSETIYTYVKNVIQLIDKNELYTISQIHDYATTLLKQPIFQQIFNEIISRISTNRNKEIKLISW